MQGFTTDWAGFYRPFFFWLGRKPQGSATKTKGGSVASRKAAQQRPKATAIFTAIFWQPRYPAALWQLGHT